MLHCSIVSQPHSCRCSLTALIRRYTGKPDARVRNSQLESLSDVTNLASACYWIASKPQGLSAASTPSVRPGLACLSGVSTEARTITRVLFSFIINLHRGQISGHDQHVHALISVQSATTTYSSATHKWTDRAVSMARRFMQKQTQAVEPIHPNKGEPARTCWIWKLVSCRPSRIYTRLGQPSRQSRSTGVC